MSDFWVNMIVYNFMSILQAVVKNGEKRERFKRLLLNIRDSISAMYPEDSGFPKLTL